MNRLSRILFLSLIVILTSCSKYYISQINTTGRVIAKDSSSRLFTHENDSVLISYNFYGENAPVHITVKNKLNTPIYVDWSRSALIVEGKAISYYDNKVSINGDTHSSTLRWNRDFSSSNGSFSAEANLPKNLSFIPPHAQVDKTVLYLTDSSFGRLPDSLYKEREYFYPTSGPLRLKTANFLSTTSPLPFQSYLTLFTNDNNTMKSFSYQHDFYLSKSVKSTVKPQQIPDFQTGNPDIFFTRKSTAYGKTMGGLAIATVLVGSAALEANSDNQADQTK